MRKTKHKAKTSYINMIVKPILFVWLMFCALAAWIGCAVTGFIFAFSNYAFMYKVTPWFGLTIAICMFKCAMFVKRSNPEAYFGEKYDRFFRKV